jgi:ATP-dependent Zn protease
MSSTSNVIVEVIPIVLIFILFFYMSRRQRATGYSNARQLGLVLLISSQFAQSYKNGKLDKSEFFVGAAISVVLILIVFSRSRYRRY